MKMISRRDFLKASAVVGAAAAMTACGGSSSSTAASSVASSTAASAAATNGSANIGVCIYQFADNFMTLYRTDLEEYLKDIPMKRFGTAEEIGDVVTMLAGPACSYMTGQVIVLDGGLSL